MLSRSRMSRRNDARPAGCAMLPAQLIMLGLIYAVASLVCEQYRGWAIGGVGVIALLAPSRGRPIALGAPGGEPSPRARPQ
jgi:hypothetical protein